MGYRNEVALTIRNEDWNKLVILANQHEQKEEIISGFQCASITQI